MKLETRRPPAGWRIILVIAVGLGLQLLLHRLPVTFQHHYGDLLRALIVLLIGSAASWLVERWLARISHERLGSRRVTSLRFVARLVLYLAIALALLAAFGVGLSSVVFGSAFVTVIIGLAGQNFFSNLIAGIGLIIFHPFEVGDRVTFVSSSYPLLVSSYPHENMKPGYTGVVTDINLAYTTFETDDSVPMMIPNGIIIQAAIHNQQRRRRQSFRFRFDLSLDLNPSRLLSRLEERLNTWPYPVQVQLADVGSSTFSILVTGEAPEQREDAVKNDVLTELIPLVQELRGTTDTSS